MRLVPLSRMSSVAASIVASCELELLRDGHAVIAGNRVARRPAIAVGDLLVRRPCAACEPTHTSDRTYLFSKGVPKWPTSW
jgi:hypothetical protein